MKAMRNPMDSWRLNDSRYENCSYVIGKNDMDLSLRLQKAGPEHCKHLRMIYVWADITAPRYWWTEFDTYRAGVEKVSCSTMHKLMARPLIKGDFENDCVNDDYLKYVLDSINASMEAWQAEEDPEYKKQIWRSIIQALPQSYLQTRTVMISYAALRNIVRQREGHKLKEWKTFIDWTKTLPFAKELIYDNEGD